MKSKKAEFVYSDNYADNLTNILGTHWSEKEQQALRGALTLVQKSDALRASFLFSALDSENISDETKDSRILYWKNLRDGKLSFDERGSYGLAVTLSPEKKAEAKTIIEEFRQIHAGEVLKQAGVSALSLQRATSLTILRSIDSLYDEFLDGDEIAIREAIQTKEGYALIDFYDTDLRPAYTSTLHELKRRHNERDTTEPSDIFNEKNKALIDHAEFLKQQIRIAREKFPGIDNPAPVLTDVVMLAPDQRSPKKIIPAAAPIILAAKPALIVPKEPKGEDSPLIERLFTVAEGLSSGLKALFKKAIKTIIPSPKTTGWGLALSGAVASVALAATLHSGTVNDYDVNVTKTTPPPTQGIGQQAVSEKASLPTALTAETITPAVETVKPTKIAMVAAPAVKKATLPLEHTAAVSVSDAFNSQQAKGRPITEEPFDIATLRSDLTTLTKACEAVGTSDENSVCSGLKAPANE